MCIRDRDIIERLALSENELEMMEHSIAEMEKDCGLDRNAALADMRYTLSLIHIWMTSTL